MNSRGAGWGLLAATPLMIAFATNAPLALAAEQVILGQAQYTRTAGPPNQFTDTFALPPTLVAPFRLHVQNGNPDGTCRLSSATIDLNGARVARQADFNQQVAGFDRTVTLQATNIMEIRLTSRPCGILIVTLFGTVPPPTLTKLEPPSLPIAQGGTGTLVATISAAQPVPTLITLSGDNTAVAAVPATATVPANQLTAAFPVTGVAPGTATITASLNASSGHSTVLVAPAGPTITSLLPVTLQATQGASGTLTVAINAAQANDTVVTLASSTPGVVGLPPAGTVTVPAGQTSQPFTVFGNSLGPATVTASLNGTSAQSQVTVVNPLPTAVSLLPSVLPLTEGSAGTLTVTLNAAQPTDTAVALSTSEATVVGLPSGDTVNVPAHALSASFPVTGLQHGTATVTASLNGTSATAAIEVQPPPPTLQSLVCPASFTTGATGLCTVTLNATQLKDTVVSLASSASATAGVPPTVTVPANTLTAQFAVTAGAVSTATITAGPLNGSTKSADVQVVPPPPTIVSLLPSTATLFVGATINLTLTLNAAQLDDTSMPLASSASGTAGVPPTVIVPAGTLTVAVVVTGVAQGPATITAGPLNGTQAQSSINVNQSPPTVLALTPHALTLPKGKAGTLTVTIAPTQPDPTVVLLTSNDPSVGVPPSVTVPAGDSTATFPVLANAIGSSTITAGPLNGTSQQATVTVTPAELVSLAVSPAAPTIPKGTTQAFTATGTFTDASAQDLTGSAAWTSSDMAVATVTSPGGLASGLSIGQAIITAAVGTISGTATLTVTPHILTRLAVNPTNPVRTAGQTLQFQAIGALSDGTIQDVTAAVAWTCSNPAVATITSPGGLATASSQGVATITATHPDGFTAGTTLTVLPAPPTIVSLLPGAATIFPGATVPLSVTLNAAQVTDTAIPVALAPPGVAIAPPTVTVPAGSISAPVTIEGILPGQATVTAGPLNGTQAQSTITVNLLAPALVSLTPPASSLPKGKSTTLTMAIAPLQPTPTVVALASSDPNALGVPPTITVPAGAGTADFSVMASNVTAPIATVTAGPLNGTSRQASVTVTAPELVSLAVAPGTPVIGVGQAQPFTATGTFTDGTVRDVTGQVTWASGDPRVATIAATGVAAGVAGGVTTIQAAQGALSAQAALRVEAPLLVSLAVSPTSATIALGGTQQFTATGTFNDGSTANLSASVRWSSADLSVASVNAGAATGQGGGQTTITAALGGRSASATLTVTAPPTPPVLITIVTPSAGDVVRGTVIIQVSADPTASIHGLELISPRGLFDEDPFPNTFVAFWDTTTVPDGPFTIQVTAFRGYEPEEPIAASVEVLVQNLGVAGTFTPAPVSLPAPRARHTATVLRDGRALIAGGVDPSTGNPLAGADLFTPATPSLPPRPLAAGMLQARSGHTATLLPSGLVLIAGGTTVGGAPTNSVEFFDPATESFLPSAAILVTPRSGHTATLLLDGRILFAGGDAAGSLEMFDPASGASQVLAARLPAPTREHTATLLPDGTILFAGGTTDGTNPLGSAAFFDPDLQDFRPGTLTLVIPRFSHTATLMPDGRVLLIGGRGGVGPLNAAEFYDPYASYDPATGNYMGAINLAGAQAPISVTEHAAFLAPTASLFLTGGAPDGRAVILFRLAARDALFPDIWGWLPAGSSVPREQVFSLRFSEPVDVRTLTPATLSLVDLSSGQPVAGSVGAGESGLLAFFTPAAPLAPGSAYELRIGSGLHDTGGLPVPPFAFSFTTQPPTLQAVAVRPAGVALQAGGSLQLAALGVFTAGPTQDLTPAVEWTSLSPAVASVSAGGLVTAVASGTATIQARSGPIVGSATISVTTTLVSTLVSLAVAPTAGTVSVGDTQAFTATGTFSDGSAQDLTAAVAWTSQQPDVATVSVDGLAAALAPGLATIRAQFGGASATGTLAVFGGNLALTGYRPDRALVGQAFALRGASFSPRRADNPVTFTGPGGARLPAEVTAASPNELMVTVPAGAQTGVVTVEVGGQSASLFLPAGPDPAPVITTVHKQHAAVAIDPGLGLAVLTNWDGSVTLFDLAAQQAVATLPLGPSGAYLSGVTINPATHVAVIFTRGGLVLVDLVRRQLAGNITPQVETSFPGALFAFLSPGAIRGGAVDGGRNQAVLSGADDHLWIVDVAAGTTLKRIPVGGSGPMVLDAARGVAVLLRQWAVNPATGVPNYLREPKAVLVDLTAGRVREEIPLPAPGQAVVLDEGSQRALITHGNFLTVLDLAARAVVGSVPLPGAGLLGLDAAANLVATLNEDLAGQGVNALVFLDLRTGQELGRVPLSYFIPAGLALDPAGRRALVFGDVGFEPSSSTLAVINYGAFVPGPRLDAVAPDFAAPGDPVTLRGGGLAGAAVTVAAPDGGRQVATVTSQDPGAFGILVPQGSGAGPVQVTTAAGMTPSPLPLVVPAPELSVAITSPLPGETRDASPVAVQGTVTPVSPTTSVTVNGVPAVIQGTRWAAANVPVQGGQINVSATDPANPALLAEASAVINGGAGAPGPLALTAAPASGTAPLATTLSLTTNLPPPGPDNAYALGLAGSGADVAVTAPSPLALAYLRPGLYAPTVTAPAGAGTASAQAVVRVDAPPPPPALLALSLTPESPVLGKGEILFVDAVGLFADGSTRKVTTLATWTVGDPTIASVSGAGTLQGLAPGATTVTATLGGVTIATPVTITPPQLDGLTVTPAARTILRGQTVSYRATGQFSDGTTEDVTAQVTWTPADATIATVDATGLATGVGVGSTTLRATLGTIAGTATLTVTPPQLQEVRITPNLPVLLVPEALQLAVLGTFSDGTTQDLTAQATWTSGTPSIATVSASGLATAVAQGATVIRATVRLPAGSGVGSFSYESVLTVLAGNPLQNLAVTLPAIAGLPGFGFQFSAGTPLQFAATGTFADGSTQDLTRIVTWTSSDPTVAAVTPSGLAQTLGAGFTTLTATRGAVSGAFSLGVFDQPVSLELTPATSTRAVGQTLQFTALGVGLAGARRDVTPFVTWTSSNPAVAAISSTGLATALAPGTTTLSAALDVYRVPGLPPGRLTATTPLTVLPALTGLTIPPTVLTAPLGETLQLQAQGTFSDASTGDLTSLVTWASSNPAVATITPGGLLTAQAIGVAQITATRDGIVGALQLGVTDAPPSITITSPAPGAIITADRVVVRGTLAAAPSEVGVIVNGRLAQVNGSQWAVEVPLVQGSNVLTASVLDASGAARTTGLDVTVPQPTPVPLVLRAVPESGVAPLRVTFEIVNQTGQPWTQFEFDATGSGTFGPPTAPFDTAQVTYTGTGLLFPALRATDAQGNTFTATTIVSLLDRVALDALLQAKWAGLRAALQAGDLDKAVAVFAPDQQGPYRTAFAALQAQLPQIAQDLQTIQLIFAQDGEAQYRLRRPELVQGQVVSVTHYVRFLQDAVGVWRIAGF